MTKRDSNIYFSWNKVVYYKKTDLEIVMDESREC